MCIIEANRVNKYFVEHKNHVKIHKQTLHYMASLSASMHVDQRDINALHLPVNRPLAHDVIAPVTMHLEDKLAIYA